MSNNSSPSTSPKTSNSEKKVTANYQGISSVGVTLIFLAALFVGITLVLLSYWHTRNIEEKTLVMAAKNYSNIISEFRSFYSKEILSRIKGSDVTVTHAYHEQPHTIPIPATMTIELARRISRSANDIQIQIVSQHPFPWRGTRTLSEFEINAIEALGNTSSDHFAEILEKNDKDILYFASPMRMNQTCVNCHNAHPDSPKRDWQVGDIRGLQVVILPASQISSENQLGLAYIVAFIIASFISIFSVILWLVNNNKIAFAQLRSNSRKIQKTLAELEFFKDALDKHAIVSIADSEGRITYANDKFVEISGYNRDQLIGKNHRIVRSEEHSKVFYENMWDTIISGNTWHGDIKNRSSNGTTYWVNSTIVPFLNEKTGRPFQYVSIRTDISAHKNLEEEIESNHRFLEALTNTISQGVMAVSSQENITFMNIAASKLIGRSQQETLNQSIHNVLVGHKESTNTLSGPASPLLTAIRDGQSWKSDEEIMQSHQGLSYPISINAVPLFLNGEVQGSVIVFQDISERKKSESALRESEERFRHVASTAHEAIITINEAGQILFWNHAAAKIFGYKDDEVLGQPLTAVIPSHLQEAHQKGLSAAITRGSLKHLGETLELPALRKDGQEILLEVILSTWKTSGQRHFTAMARDITERKRMLEDLADAKSNAEQANQAKSDFLANMSHEIRTPMNAIIGMSHLALMQPLEPRIADYVAKIHQAGQSLLRIINDILDFSKIEAGKLEIETISFNLDEEFQSLLSLLSMKAHEKQLELVLDKTPDLPTKLLGDPTRINQILLNLVSNAIKFTEKGEVVIHVEKHSLSGDRLELNFSISDSGIGMKPEQLDKLFSAFGQADTSTTRKYGGTGLGLAISKQLVELMGGKISVESVFGQGSRFSFWLPLSVDTNTTEEAASDHVLKELEIVLMAPPGTHRQSMIANLEAFGVTVRLVDQNADLKSQLKQPESNDFKQIIILDPGFDTASIDREVKRIREILPTDTIVVLLPNLSNEQAMIQLEKLSKVSYLTKPVTASDLFDYLINLTQGKILPASLKRGNKENRFGKVVLTLSESLKGKKILLAEDNQVNQQIALELLNMVGLEVEVVENGLEALSKVRNNKYDLVLIDLQMPIMDGYEATRRIQSEIDNPPPLIAMTANALESDRKQSEQAGMKGHVAKPVDPENLYRVINRWIGSGHDDVTLPPSDLPQEHSQMPTSEQLPGLDLELSLQRSAGSVSLFLKLLDQFQQDQRDAVEQISNAILEGDLDVALRHAHTLKGLAGSIAAGEVQTQAEKVEGLLQDGNNQGLLTDELNTLDNQIQNLVVHIQNLPQREEESIQQKQFETLNSEPSVDHKKVYSLLQALEKPLNAREPQTSRKLIDQLTSLQVASPLGNAIQEISSYIGKYKLKEASQKLAELLEENSAKR
jgi:two-component system, sensor histidine kinase and response regulator